MHERTRPETAISSRNMISTSCSSSEYSKVQQDASHRVDSTRIRMTADEAVQMGRWGGRFKRRKRVVVFSTHSQAQIGPGRQSSRRLVDKRVQGD